MNAEQIASCSCRQICFAAVGQKTSRGTLNLEQGLLEVGRRSARHYETIEKPRMPRRSGYQRAPNAADVAENLRVPQKPRETRCKKGQRRQAPVDRIPAPQSGVDLTARQ